MPTAGRHRTHVLKLSGTWADFRRAASIARWRSADELTPNYTVPTIRVTPLTPVRRAISEAPLTIDGSHYIAVAKE